MKRLWIVLMSLLMMTACSSRVQTNPTAISTPSSPTPTPVVETPTPQPTSTPTHTPTPTNTPTPSQTPTPTSTPTVALPVGLNTPIPQADHILSPANVSDLVEIAKFGSGILYDYYITDDQQTLVAVFSNAIRFFDAQTLEQTRVFPVSLPEMWTNYPIPYSLSKDASTIAVLGDKQIQVWRTTDGSLIQTIQIEMNKGIRGGQLELSADGQHLYALIYPQFMTQIGPNQGYIEESTVWRVKDGSVIVTSKPVINGSSVFSPDGTLVVINDGSYYESPQYSQTAVYRVADGTKAYILSESLGNQAFQFSPDGKLLAYCINSVLSIYQVSDWSEVDKIPLKQDCDSSRLNFDTTSQYIVTGSHKEPVVVIYHLDDKSKSRLTSTTDQIEFIGLSSDGANLLANTWGNYGAYNRITLWNVLHQKLLAEQQRWDYMWEYRFSPDGSVASFPGETADTSQLLNTQDGATIATLQGKWPLFLPDGESVITWDGSGFSRWDIDGGNLLGTYPIEDLQLPPKAINSIEFSPDDRLYAMSNYAVTAFDIDQLTPIQEYEGSRVAFSNDGQVFAISNGTTVTITNIADGSLLGEIKLKGLNVNEIALSPAGDYLAVGEYLGSARFRMSLWDVNSGSEIKKYDSNDYYGKLEFTPDGSLLVGMSSSGNPAVVFWNIPKGQILRSEVGGEWVSSAPMDLAPDGKTVAYCLGQDITIMEVGLWEIIKTISPETGCYEGTLTYSPDGKMIASAFQGGRVDIWDVASGALLSSIKDNDTPFQGRSNVQIAFSPDGKYLVTSGGGMIRVWGISPYSE